MTLFCEFENKFDGNRIFRWQLGSVNGWGVLGPVLEYWETMEILEKRWPWNQTVSVRRDPGEFRDLFFACDFGLMPLCLSFLTDELGL